jgi:hypothetical protein
MRPVSIDRFTSRPWEVPEEQRPGLLAWFMDAEFTRDEDLKLLVAMNGSRRGPRGQETPLRAQGMTALAAGTPTFVAFYSEIRRLLTNARHFWQRAVQERDRQQKELLATLAFRAFGDLREEVTSLEVERDPDTSAVIWPVKGYPTPKRQALSLAGELGIAMYDEMLNAKKAGICKVCHRPWLSPLRKSRQLCGRDECVRSWRNEHRKPEDPEKVYERVKRSRARRAKRGKGR